MAIPKEEIEHLAKLARLGLSAKEKETIAPDLANILEFVGKLSQVNTDTIEPLPGGTDLFNAFRVDKPRVSKGVGEDLLHGVTAIKDAYFKVPRILE